MEEDIFAAYNDTELYEVAREAGLGVMPNTPREKLIAYLLGEEEPPEAPQEIDLWRHAIMSFLIEHWRQVETQLTCPAKSKDPLSCFQCPDTQVMCCLISNESALYQIRLHRKGDT